MFMKSFYVIVSLYSKNDGIVGPPIFKILLSERSTIRTFCYYMNMYLLIINLFSSIELFYMY